MGQNLVPQSDNHLEGVGGFLVVGGVVLSLRVHGVFHLTELVSAVVVHCLLGLVCGEVNQKSTRGHEQVIDRSRNNILHIHLLFSHFVNK